MKKLLLKIAENIQSQPVIKGPGINSLKSTLREMLGLGAPVERNDIGFNQIDYPKAFRIVNSNEFFDDGLPLNMVKIALGILNTYKKRQVPHYDQMKKNVEAEILQQMPDTVASTEHASITVFNNEINYGKVKIQLNEPN